MMTFKLMWQNDVGHNTCKHAAFHNSQGSTKTLFEGDWWFWCHFVPNLLGYIVPITTGIKKDLTRQSYCKNKMVQFFCLTVYIVKLVGYLSLVEMWYCGYVFLPHNTLWFLLSWVLKTGHLLLSGIHLCQDVHLKTLWELLCYCAVIFLCSIHVELDHNFNHWLLSWIIQTVDEM